MFKLLKRGISGRRELVATLGITTPSASVLGSVGYGDDREMDHTLVVLHVQDSAFVQLHPPPPENPIRYEVDEEGRLLAFQNDENGEKVEVPLETEEFLKLPGQEDEQDEEAEPEAEESPSKETSGKANKKGESEP